MSADAIDRPDLHQILQNIRVDAHLYVHAVEHLIQSWRQRSNSDPRVPHRELPPQSRPMRFLGSGGSMDVAQYINDRVAFRRGGGKRRPSSRISDGRVRKARGAP